VIERILWGCYLAFAYAVMGLKQLKAMRDEQGNEAAA
jgi:hypothetical protein